MNPYQKAGGLAFPLTIYKYSDQGSLDIESQHFGMSLRDWFAGMALQGLLSSDVNGERSLISDVETAFRAADLMIAERDKEAQ